MRKPCRGAMDKTPPKDISWKSVPHRLFFARSYTDTWGHGGVAFLNPQSSINDRSYMRIYRITLEQFNDLLIQENVTTEHFESPLVDSRDIEFLVKSSFMSVESIKGGWYSNILYLGEQDGIPILTMTCSLSDVEKFKSGELPVCAPPKAYENSLLKGLLEGKELSSEEAIGYLKDAVARNL